MKKLLLIFVGILFISTAFTQTFHEDTYVKFLISKDSVISAFLRSEGGIQLGTSSSTRSGTLRWTGSDLQIYTGSAWTSVMSSLDAATVKSLYESNLNTNAFTDALWSELVTNSAHRIGNGTDHAQVALNVDAIALNTAKISYPPADQSKLSGIESNATADQTGSEIKVLYENETNTNAFTDAEKTKLGTIETNAAADQSDAEIKIAYENNANTNAFTDAESNKLGLIEAGAEVNVQSDWNASSGDAFIFNKPIIPTISDEAYGSGWDGDTDGASKNSIYDQIQNLAIGGGGGSGIFKSVSEWVTAGTNAERGVQLRDSLAVYSGWPIYWDISTRFDSCTIPPTLVIFKKGSYINATGEVYGTGVEFMAGITQIFNIDIDLKGIWKAPNAEAYPEWFGAKGDGTGTADAAAIQKALEVFCIPDTMGMVDFNYYDKLTRWYTQGIKVKVTGSIYNIEKTIEFPPFGNLEIGHFTTLYGGDGFYDPFIEILSTPYWIDGGRFLVRRYEEQTGYTGSGGDAEKIQYAYNKHPVFRLYLNERLQSVDNWGTTNTMYKSTIQNVETKMIKRYTRQDVLTPSLLYSAFFISSDTTQYTSGTLDYQRSYTMVEYHTGDDFSNVTTDGAAPTGGFLINIPSAAGISGPYPETVTPNDWSNGSIVEEDNGAYFQVLKNIHIDHADTGIYIQGAGEGVAGWTMDNLNLNGCLSALYIGDRAWQNLVTGLYIQSSGPSTVGSEVPQVKISSSQNYINGGLMDMYHDSTIYITNGRYQGTAGNRIELTTQGDRLLEDFTKYENANMKYKNLVGTHPMWFRAIDNTHASTSSAYWFQGSRMGLFEYGNTSVDRAVNPQTLLELVSAPAYTPSPLLFLQSQTSAYTTDFTSFIGLGSLIEINNQSTSTGLNPFLKGMGTGMVFSLSDTSTVSERTDALKVNLGWIGFRAGASGATQSATDGTFQVWSWDGTNGSPIITGTQDGKFGFGVDNVSPAYTIDASASGTIRTTNLTDDGTDVEVDSDLTVNEGFTYGDNVYGLAYYSGAGYTISTSGTVARQLLTNLTLKNSKNLTLTSNKIILGRQGVIDVEASITMKNASATCSKYTVVAELYNSSDTKLDESPSSFSRDCSTDEFVVPVSMIFDVTTDDNYIVFKVAGDGAVNVDIGSVSIKIKKIDE